MSSRRRIPPDLAAVKRSRAGCTGAITKALDKLKAIPSSTSEEVRLINSKDVDRTLSSIMKTEASFLHSLEDAQLYVPEDTEEAFQLEEELAADLFTTAISATRDLGEQLLCLKAVLNGLANFSCDLDAIQDTLTSKPDSNQVSDLTDLKVLFSSLRSQWQDANLPTDHPIKAELDSCRRTLATLGADVTAASDKSDSHSSTSSSSASTSGPCYILGKNDLPTITVPKFTGDILDWSSFWASFKSTIEDRTELSNTQRLHYLRQAIVDPELQLLLHSPAETPDFYLEVVDELKERFNKTREIHKLLSRTLADLSSPKQTRADLRRLVDLVKRTISSMKATKQYDMDSFLSSIVFSILPSRLQTTWAQHTKKDKGVPPISQLLLFLREHAETLPSSGAPLPATPSDTPSWKNNSRRSDRKQEAHKPKPVHSVTPSSSYKWECSLCKPEKHPLYGCPKWASYSVSQRLAQVKAKNLCANCLAGGHTLNNCKSTYRCRDCGQQHHTTIHQESATTSINNALHTSHQVPDALMTTAQVLLVGPRGQEIKARALIDSGAGLSLISHKVAQNLGLPLSPSKLQLSGIQGTSCKPANFLTTLTISPLHNREKKIQCTPAVVQVVTSDLPPEKMESVTGLPHMLGLHLADENYNLPGRIDILLGADMAPQIMTRRMLQTGKDTEPIAQATEFGWVISGPATRSYPSTTQYPANHTSLQPEEGPHTDDLVFNFWKSEEVPGDEEASLSYQEEQAELHYVSNTIYSSDNCRYQVTLPKKPELFPLGDSRSQAASRYLANERSILRRKVWEPFQQVIQQYLDLGHAEKVPLSEPPPLSSYYLPMHAVFKDSSSTTKLRVVFDGSAVTTSGTSLNQALLVGPTLQPTLSDILLKFRCYPIALNSDISKMYREVLLHPPDKDLHRFVWRAIPSAPLQDYRMCRVTFGVSASPYLAVRTLQQTARDHGGDYPEVTHHIFNSFYVDDFLGGADSTQEAAELFLNMRKVLQQGGFNLTKWRSSSKEVLQGIPTHLQEATPIKESTSFNSPTLSKALGLIWDSEQDVMSPSINVSTHYTLTKRGLLRDVSKTYDILGWIAPAVLLMKILFQALWKTGQDWDDEIPPDLADQHSHWRRELPLLKGRTLPRCYRLIQQSPLLTELHAFADASTKAFGAVIYCRTTYKDHPPLIVLVTAKTKVAKINPPTVPRLELCGAVLLVKLLTSTANILGVPPEHWHAWSDSSIVLAWLDGQPRQFKQYVSNRVSYILQATSPHHWKHVPTAENPADCASRGMMPGELLHHKLWWEGPTWLQQDPYPVPHQPPRRAVEPLELRAVHVMTVLPPTLADRIQQLGKPYHTILAVTAWCLRFLNRIRHGRPQPDLRTKQLTGADITKARNWILMKNQQLNFPKEMRALERGMTIPPTSRLKALNPVMDSSQLLRVGGRLGNSALSLSQQHPIIGDSKDAIIIKWFEHVHLSLCHCGPSLLLSYTGSHLHILGARKLSRKICSQCRTCRRLAPRWSTQLMAELPAQRVTPARAFTHTGMDFAGPFSIKMGHVRRPVTLQAYLCIFVCLTYKAVHIEVVSDQTTPAFLACLHRFISRRNCPQHIYSDNGPNFTGAKNQLKQLYAWLRSDTTNDAIQHYLLSHHGVTWHNSPPAAPHFGGLWESAVRSAKKHLTRVLGSTLYSFEELTTISCQVEACLNSRPLLPTTSHNQDGLATLTASHFLLYSSPAAYPEDPRLPERPDLLKKWNHCQSVVQHFWQRWSREYLQHLQSRSKWQSSSPNLQEGDIVMLKPEKTFKCHWPLARVTAVFPGQDGLVRVAEVKTATGTYKRPVVKLSLLHRPDKTQEPSQPLPPAICPDISTASAGQLLQPAAVQPTLT